MSNEITIDVKLLAANVATELNNISKAAKGADDSFSKFGKEVIVLNQAFDLAKKSWQVLNSIFGTAINQAIEQEKAINSLNYAFKSAGESGNKASKDFQNFANELQKVTTFSDETTIAAAALFTQLTKVTGEGLKQATIAAQNLSATIGIDLESAMRLLAKSSEDGGTGLKRYGIEVVKGKNESENLANAINAVNDKLGGVARSKIEGYAGKIALMRNEWEDVQKSIGQQIIQNQYLLASFSAVIKGIGFLPTVLNVAAGAVNILVGSLIYLATGPMVLLMLGIEKAASLFDTQLAESIRKNREEIQSYSSDLIASGQMGIEEAANQNAIKEEQELLHQQKLTEIKVNANQTRTAETQKTLEWEKQQAAGFYETWQGFIFRHRKYEQLTNQERVQNFRDTMGYISTLSTAKNRELMIIGKAAAVTTTTIDGIVAVQKALAAAPPPFNFALAALVGVAAAANVAKVVGVQLAEGGMVMPRAGGVQATIGEAGRPEVVIPLDDPRTQERLGGMGGNTFNIVVNGAVTKDNNELIDNIIDGINTAIQYRNVSLRTA